MKDSHRDHDYSAPASTATKRRRTRRLNHEKGLPPEIPAVVPPTPVLFKPRPLRRPKLGVVGGTWRPRRRITEWSGSDKWYIVLEVWTDAEWAELTEAEKPERYEHALRRLGGIGWYLWSLVSAEDARQIKEENDALWKANPHWR